MDATGRGVGARDAVLRGDLRVYVQLWERHPEVGVEAVIPMIERWLERAKAPSGVVRGPKWPEGK